MGFLSLDIVCHRHSVAVEHRGRIGVLSIMPDFVIEAWPADATRRANGADLLSGFDAVAFFHQRRFQGASSRCASLRPHRSNVVSRGPTIETYARDASVRGIHRRVARCPGLRASVAVGIDCQIDRAICVGWLVSSSGI